MKTKTLAAVAALAALAAVTGCTNQQGTTEAPVFITVDLQDQTGFVNIATPAPVQLATIVLTSHLKDSSATDPQGFANTQVNEYTVSYRRTDGGTLVPPVQTFGCGVLVPSGGSSTLSNFPVLTQPAVTGTPFDQLLPFNGGIDRQTGRDEIDTAFDITFFGTTVSGLRVQSQTASGILIFRYTPVAGSSVN
jgi:hypothetical protein